MIVPAQTKNLQVKPRWVAPVGIMESVVAYNCRKYGMPPPVLAMPMWEGAGNRAIDLSGHGNHGDFINNAKWVGTTNGIGTEFPTDAGSDRIDLGSIDSGNPLSGFPTGEITILSKVYINTTTPNNDYSRVFDKSSAANVSAGWSLFWSDFGVDDKFALQVRNAGLFTYTPKLTRPAWYTVAGTIKSGDSKIYIDGVEKVQSATAFTFPSTTTNAAIGNWNHTTDRQWNGSILYVNIWDTILSEKQIKFATDNPYFMYQMPEELYGYSPAAVGAIMNQFQKTNMGADLYNGAIIA